MTQCFTATIPPKRGRAAAPFATGLRLNYPDRYEPKAGGQATFTPTEEVIR
jgi:hypothetical protein